MNKKNLIEINLNWKDVKDYRIDYHFNGFLLMGWLMILDDDDRIVEGWEFKFENI